jgi:hypothetical protein
VDQALVAGAATLGPFVIDPAKGSSWPPACKLTNSAQLRGLFPGITRVSSTGPGISNVEDCRYYLKTSFDRTATRGSYVEVWLLFVGAQSPHIFAADEAWATAQRDDPGRFPLYANLGNALSCFYNGAGVTCLQGDFLFDIAGQKATGGPNPSTDDAVWVDQAEIPLAEVLAPELALTPGVPDPKPARPVTTSTTIPSHKPASTPAWAAGLGAGTAVLAPGSPRPGHVVPSAVAMGFMPAFHGAHFSAICGYFPAVPVLGDCQGQAAKKPVLDIGARGAAVGYTAIWGTRALVALTGRFCKHTGPKTRCATTVNPTAGLSGGKTFADLWAAASTDLYGPGSFAQAPLLPCVRVGEEWYVAPPMSS